MFKKLGVECGYYTTEKNRKVDCLRIRHSDPKATEHVKKRSEQVRAIRKGVAIKNEFEERETFEYGQL